MLSQSVIDDLWNKSGSGETKWKNNDNGSFSSNTGKTSVADESQSPDNGYDQNGKQINNNGGDKTDYKYNKNGKVISSTSVKSIGAVSSSSPLRGYGFKGFAMASGSTDQMDFSSPFFAWGMVIKSALGGLFKSTAGTTVFRAVDATEGTIIKSTGKFGLQQGGVEAKYFAQSVQDAHWYGKGLYPDGYSIIQATVKSPVNAAQYWFPHVDIGAYVFPAEALPYIIPK